MIEFAPSGAGVTARLAASDVGVLTRVPDLLETLGEPDTDPAAARLSPSAYPDDPAADAEFRRFDDVELDRGRAEDRAAFLRTVAAGTVQLDAEDAARWLRVINEARLLLGARIGIDDDGWSYRDLRAGPRTALLHYLSWAQEGLLAALDPAG